MAMPLATPALMLRVDPYMAIDRTSEHAANAASESPAPS